MNLSAEGRINNARRVITLFFILGIFFSFRLWIDDRSFPLLPLMGDQPFLPPFLTYGVCGILVLSLGFLLFRWHRYAGWAITVCLFVLVLNDQNRLQAWVYLYGLLLLGLNLAKSPEAALRYMRVVIVAVYIWSGIYKINPMFIDNAFFGMLVELFGVAPDQTYELLPFGYAIPVIEILTGVFLFFPRTRFMGCMFALATHMFILVYLSPIGINANGIVYPWNVAMILLVLFLFYRSADQLRLTEARKDFRLAGFLVLTWIMPVLNFFGCWDHYLSFSYYSAKTSTFYLSVSNYALKAMNEDVEQYALDNTGSSGGVTININHWSLGELGVPFYPEHRAFGKFQTWFCEKGIPTGDAYFLEFPAGPEHEHIMTKCAGTPK